MSLEDAIGEGAAQLGLATDAAQRASLAAHLRLVEKWNRVHNLTAVRETQQMVALHVLDSLSLLPQLDSARTLVDVGSGAGFPGIPLAILRPELDVTLLDSSSKKCTFLEQARTELGLSRIQVACARVEQWSPPRTFERVVSRAFADLSDFVAQARHLLAPGGRMLAMKGVYPFEELARVPATHRVAEVIALSVPSLEAKRHVVCMEAA